jgi:hypothetical protein
VTQASAKLPAVPNENSPHGSGPVAELIAAETLGSAQMANAIAKAVINLLMPCIITYLFGGLFSYRADIDAFSVPKLKSLN